MCNLFAFVFGGLFAGVVSGFGRPVLKGTVKGGIAMKRKAERAGRRVKSELDDLVADARAEMDEGEEN